MEGNPEVLRDGPIRLEALDDGAIWRVVLATPKANILDMQKCDILSEVFAEAARARELKGVIIEGDGPHFSFGASVQEHLPDQIEAMLHGFHRLFFRMLEAKVVTLAAVRGQCLGGAMELAIFCNRIFASPDARFGQPEIVLGVLAPVASVMLSDRVGRGRAEDLLLTGRSSSAAEGLAIGLVDELADDPGAAALEYAREHLLPKSASSLRFAVKAARAGFEERVRKELAGVERLFLEELITTADAQEGLTAFLEKRDPIWKNA
ncbi:MAG: cyclohexa-1,5-dienecarbonyl-CoA hydratase [Gemmatimonadota bacterium]